MNRASDISHSLVLAFRFFSREELSSPVVCTMRELIEPITGKRTTFVLSNKYNFLII